MVPLKRRPFLILKRSSVKQLIDSFQIRISMVRTSSGKAAHSASKINGIADSMLNKHASWKCAKSIRQIYFIYI